jgi:beta-lactamase superfamily II metal-dependent hydrolase
MGARTATGKILTALLLGILLLSVSACANHSNKGETKAHLQVHFIDVGQGDSILIDYGTTEVLIDGGEKSPGVTDYLKKYVDGDLEVMVATHPHSDHIGGLIDVLDKYTIDAIWTNGEAATTKTYTDFTNSSLAEGARIAVARRGDTITAGALTFHVLNPPATLFGDANNDSIVLQLDYGNVDFLFEGDAGIDAENSMISAGVLSDIDILKVGHHGSSSASSHAFLAITRPEVAIYMAGVGNPYGHPHQETLTALAGIGAKIYGTDKYGTIVIDTDGVTYSVTTEKTP